jgi:hypothetical protein
MTEHERGSDRLGRCAKRFLTPLRKYEIWLQLLRGETTIAEAADRYGVDRSTIMRLRMVAKDGAIPGAGLLQARRAGQAGPGAGGGTGGGGQAGRGGPGAGRQAGAGGGKGRWG